jgi:hypothetical protein
MTKLAAGGFALGPAQPQAALFLGSPPRPFLAGASRCCVRCVESLQYTTNLAQGHAVAKQPNNKAPRSAIAALA